MKWLALVLAVAGCGDNLADPGTPRSGSRLKLAWYEYEDGTRELETAWYYDAELDEHCTPTAWSDGQRYCKPPTDDAVYVTDTCTRSLGRTARGATPAPFFATRFHLQDQSLPSRVFRRGAATLPPATVWQKHSYGCVGPMQPGDFDYFELGEEITGLVQMRRGQPRGDGELAIIDELGDDGLRVPIGLYDRAADAPCTPDEHANAETADCAPDDAGLISYFHESSCLEPVLAVLSGFAPAVAKQHDPLTHCWRYHDVGNEVAATPLYVALPGTCTSASPPGGARFFGMAGPHATQQLVRERLDSETRLARIKLVHDSTRVTSPLLFDRELATECKLDGELRCVPVTSAEVMPFFSDPQCATLLDLALVPAGACDTWVPYAHAGDAVYPLVNQYTSTVYWLSTGDTCAKYVPPIDLVPWRIGPAIDPATFATAKLVIDP